MSMKDKLAAIMERPGQDPTSKDDVAWWMKYAGRGLGTVGGGIAIFLGLWNCFFILLVQMDCFLSGVCQMLAGFLVITIEAPCCCLFIDFVQQFSNYVDSRPYWNRAVGYCTIALPAIIFCPGLGSILGSGLLFGTGIIYGMMSIGKKAPLDAMRTTATTSQPTTNTKSALAENAQVMGMSNPASPDSNV